jgi:hypothetical protein
MPASKPNFEERFWKRVKKLKSGCWIWTGSRTPQGYGQFIIERAKHAAYTHRASWTYTYGPIPEGVQVLHHCDNPPCVNPQHLFLGTHCDNLNDMSQKGRRHTKLTEAQVIEIRTLYVHGKRGSGYSALSKKFGVTPKAVAAIVRRHFWTHI